jgi:hypothetical protein
MEASMKRIINAALALALVGALGVMFTHDVVAQQKGTGTGKRGALFVDQNGDGVCDNFGTNAGKKLGNNPQGKGYGPGDGTGNMGQGPKDGTGYGKKGGLCTSTGVCDGSGPKGSVTRRGNK